MVLIQKANSALPTQLTLPVSQRYIRNLFVSETEERAKKKKKKSKADMLYKLSLFMIALLILPQSEGFLVSVNHSIVPLALFSCLVF